MNTRNQLKFFQSLADLTNAGFSIRRSLTLCQTILKKQTKQLQQCIAYLDEGDNFSTALTKTYPKLPTWIHQKLVIAEETAKLGIHFKSIQTHIEKKLQLKKHILKALSYPIAVSLMGLVSCVVFIQISLPQLKSLYQGSNSKLPKITQSLIWISNTLSQHLLFILITLVILSLLFYFAYKKTRLKNNLQFILWHIPIVQKIILLNLSQSFFDMLESGFQFETTLAMLINQQNQALIKTLLNKTHSKLSSGHSVYESFQDAKHFPLIFCELIYIAEESGAITQGFDNLQRYYQQSVDDSLDKLKQWLEPLVMLGLASVMTFIMMALYLPMINLGHVI